MLHFDHNVINAAIAAYKWIRSYRFKYNEANLSILLSIFYVFYDLYFILCYEDDLNREEQEIEVFTNCQGSNRENIFRTESYIE